MKVTPRMRDDLIEQAAANAVDAFVDTMHDYGTSDLVIDLPRLGTTSHVVAVLKSEMVRAIVEGRPSRVAFDYKGNWRLVLRGS